MARKMLLVIGKESCIYSNKKSMKRLVGIIVFVALTFLSRNASAVVFMIDADLNSVSPIYYQNIIPPYFTTPINTGLFLNPGDLLEISASGIWSNAPPSYNLIFGPNGNPYENIALTYP